MRRAPEVRLLRGERARLLAIAGSTRSPPRLARRARLVLLAAEGRTDRAIATALRTDPGTVARWRRRFLMQRLPGIERDAPRSGRPPSIPTSKIQVILRSTLGRRPAGGGYWSARSLAREVGVSKTTVQRVWREHGLEPRRAAETFRPNPGMRFVGQVSDFVGLYLDPPERAMVFTVDEKARPATPAARDRRSAERVEERRRGAEFRAFLQAVERETPRGQELHLLVDSRLTPYDPEVRRWLARHPRFFLHFVPPRAEGGNPLERWFAQVTRKRVGRGTSPSVARLQRAIRDHLSAPGATPRPFVWTATAEEIRARLARPVSSRHALLPSLDPERPARD